MLRGGGNEGRAVQKERDRGNSPIATTDGSIRQQLAQPFAR